jgi:hypothetical protein
MQNLQTARLFVLYLHPNHRIIFKSISVNSFCDGMECDNLEKGDDLRRPLQNEEARFSSQVLQCHQFQGKRAEADMIWMLGSIAYVAAIVTILRFFQFVADTDRSIGEFWISKEGMARKRRKVREPRSLSKKVTRQLAYRTTGR